MIFFPALHGVTKYTRIEINSSSSRSSPIEYEQRVPPKERTN